MVTSNGQRTCSYSGLCPISSRTRLSLWQVVPCKSYQSASYQSGEADLIPLLTYNDHDICISEVTRNKIWNGEYGELALLLKQNFSYTQSVSGTLAIIENQLSIKPATSNIKQPINSIEIWSDAFINFILVYIQEHISKASDLL